MSRFCALYLFAAVAGVAALPACLPHEKRYVITDASDGISVIIVNRTPNEITSFEFSGATHIDYYPEKVAANGGQIEIRIVPSELKPNNVLGVHAQSNMITVYDKDDITIDGPTEIDFSDTDTVKAKPIAGHKRLVRLSYTVSKQRAEVAQAETDKIQKEEDAQKHAQNAIDAAAKCKPNADAVQHRPRPGKTKIHGRFQCVVGDGGKSKIEIVELANGNITATVQDLIDARYVNATWTGIVEGDIVRFAYANRPTSAGYMKVDPGGHAMIGEGTTLIGDDFCSTWAITCTR